MNQYRCETCKKTPRECPITKGYWDIYGYSPKLASVKKEFVSEVGCASHSDFQNQREKVLDELCKNCQFEDEKLIEESCFDCVVGVAIIKLRQGEKE